MITKKLTRTSIIVNELDFDKKTNKLSYWIGNNIHREYFIDDRFRIDDNILRYENYLILENLENDEDRVYWYDGVMNFVHNLVTGNAWLNSLK